MYKDKKILVTGSEGLIGKELVPMLKELGANVTGVDIKLGHDLSHKSTVEFIFDLYGPFDYVFHLMGVKGSPQMTQSRPIEFMVPMLQCDTNVITTAQAKGVKRFLYTSSIALLNKQTDRFPAWAKETGETLIDAMKVQYPEGTQYCVVRPASVYGPYEDWNREGLMFISKMIKQRVIEGKKIELWNDGSSIRDVVHAMDVARGMIDVMRVMPDSWVGLGGQEKTIFQIAETICKETGQTTLMTGPKDKGDSRRMIKNWIIDPTPLEVGIKEVVEHVRNNCNPK